MVIELGGKSYHCFAFQDNRLAYPLIFFLLQRVHRSRLGHLGQFCRARYFSLLLFLLPINPMSSASLPPIPLVPLPPPFLCCVFFFLDVLACFLLHDREGT